MSPLAFETPPRKRRFRSSDNRNLIALDNEVETHRTFILVHGLFQNSEVWCNQFNGQLGISARLIAPDLRGHGASAKPDSIHAYEDGRLWADDLHNLITATGAQNPVLVGWSFGARVIMDYLRHYGDASVAGLVFLGGYLLEDPANLGAELLNSFPKMLDENVELRGEGDAAFVNAMFAEPPKPPLLDALKSVCGNIPYIVRRNMVGRILDYEDVMAGLRKPVLLLHGEEDALMLPSMSQNVSTIIPHAELKLISGCGHALFIEDAERFDQHLQSFVAGLETGY
ncbi:alpha/beta hydrolase [Parasphingorhabdus sp.]|uniref:alpha/beta fold hydrolase n=1 Tax=Parasphingorhabdus sp. TaxID=2709688 RepID=UPI00326705F3